MNKATITSFTWCKGKDDVTVTEGNGYLCVVHEMYFLLRTKPKKETNVTLPLFLEATVDTFDAIKTPFNTTTTCPNMKEQRRGSYRDCQLSFLQLETGKCGI